MDHQHIAINRSWRDAQVLLRQIICEEDIDLAIIGEPYRNRADGIWQISK